MVVYSLISHCEVPGCAGSVAWLGSNGWVWSSFCWDGMQKTPPKEEAFWDVWLCWGNRRGEAGADLDV